MPWKCGNIDCRCIESFTHDLKMESTIQRFDVFGNCNLQTNTIQILYELNEMMQIFNTPTICAHILQKQIKNRSYKKIVRNVVDG